MTDRIANTVTVCHQFTRFSCSVHILNTVWDNIAHKESWEEKSNMGE